MRMQTDTAEGTFYTTIFILHGTQIYQKISIKREKTVEMGPCEIGL